MPEPSRAGGGAAAAWRTAALPLVALLGLALPLLYVPQLGDFLYFLRPSELVPAYGTAWLLLAALCLPLWGLLTLLLVGAGAAPPWRGLRRGLERGLGALAAAVVIAALVYCLLVWVQTFGALAPLSFRARLFWPAMALGALLGAAAPRSLRRATPWALAGLLLGAACALTIPLYGWSVGGASARVAGSAVPAVRPNILILSMDALSSEHMSLYGATRPTTPQLAKFAQQATTFDQMYANANFTTPGVASILTGTRPWTHRALQLQAWPDLPTRRNSLPALLRAAGYRLGYVSTNAEAGAAKNGLGGYFQFASRDRITDVELCTDALSSVLRYVCTVSGMPLFSELVNLAAELHGARDARHYDPQLAIDPAIAWLQHVDRRQPIFLWVHLFPPHSPYVAPAPWLGRFDASEQARTIASTEPHWAWEMRSVPPALAATLDARYDESVLYVDHYAGEFLQHAQALLGPDTVVIVTADHGESFRHGYGAHTGPGLYNEIIRVPLIIRLPHQTLPVRSHALVAQVDIAPTLAQLAGIQAPALWEGHSLLGAWQDPAALPATPVFSMNFEQNPRYARLTIGSIAVIDANWKLVHYLGHPHYPQMPPLHDTLYDLAGDPAENRDVAAAHPRQLQRLRALIDAQLARHGGPVRR